MPPSTGSVPLHDPGDIRRAAATAGIPAWLLSATLALSVLALAPHLPAPFTLTDGADALAVLWPLMRGGECAAILWAARREALGARLRQALRILAATWALGCVATASYLPILVGGEPLLPEPVYRVAVNITYVTGLVAVLWMPTMAATLVQRREFLLDLAMSVLGMLVIRLVLDWSAIVVDGMVQVQALAAVAPAVLMTAALTVFVLRGVARPSRRAFWLMAAVTAGNIVVPILFAVPAGVPFGLSFAMLVSLATLWAAYAYHNDPIDGREGTPVPPSLRAFNPLPALVTAGTCTLLMREAMQTAPRHVVLLASTLVGLVVLLMLRTAATSAENLRLVADQAERDRAAERARIDALTTLTGGIAHWYNNLLTVVLGNAELGEFAVRGQDARMVNKSLGSIRSAAERAADLTRQLMAYSGRQVHRRERLDLDTFVPEAVARLRATLPPSLQVAVEPAGGPLWVHGDREQLGMVLEELVVNASQAMQGTGTVVIRLGAGGQAPPRVTVDVADDGPGAPPDVLALMFDPFFTTRGITEAAGLGLAAVRGVVAVHGGHVHAQSGPGGGLVVSIALPAADAAS